MHIAMIRNLWPNLGTFICLRICPIYAATIETFDPFRKTINGSLEILTRDAMGRLNIEALPLHSWLFKTKWLLRSVVKKQQKDKNSSTRKTK